MASVALPEELHAETDYLLPEGVSSWSAKILPSNLSQVQSSVQTLTASSNIQLNGTSSQVIFDIPANGGSSVYIDPRFTTLSFRANYQIVSAGSAANITSAVLRSHAMAHFDRFSMQSQSGLLLDDINLYSVVADALLQLEVDVAERDALALMYGLEFEHMLEKWRPTMSNASTES